MQKQSHYQIPAALFWVWLSATILSVCVLLYGAYLLQIHQTSYSTQIETVRSEVIHQAQNTLRNSSAAASTALIKDCSAEERRQFEGMLGELRTLPPSAVPELSELFNACGDFFARQKQLHTEKLLASIATLSALTTAAEPTVDSLPDSSLWQRIAVLEQERTALYFELVQKQQELISTQALPGDERFAEQESLMQEVADVKTDLDSRGQQLNQLLSRLE